MAPLPMACSSTASRVSSVPGVVRFEGDFQPNDAADLSAGYHLVHGSVFDANGVVVMEGSFKDGKLAGLRPHLRERREGGGGQLQRRRGATGS